MANRAPFVRVSPQYFVVPVTYPYHPPYNYQVPPHNLVYTTAPFQNFFPTPPNAHSICPIPANPQTSSQTTASQFAKPILQPVKRPDFKCEQAKHSHAIQIIHPETRQDVIEQLKTVKVHQNVNEKINECPRPQAPVCSFKKNPAPTLNHPVSNNIAEKFNHQIEEKLKTDAAIQNPPNQKDTGQKGSYIENGKNASPNESSHYEGQKKNYSNESSHYEGQKKNYSFNKQRVNQNVSKKAPEKHKEFTPSRTPTYYYKKNSPPTSNYAVNNNNYNNAGKYNHVEQKTIILRRGQHVDDKVKEFVPSRSSTCYFAKELPSTVNQAVSTNNDEKFNPIEEKLNTDANEKSPKEKDSSQEGSLHESANNLSEKVPEKANELSPSHTSTCDIEKNPSPTVNQEESTENEKQCEKLNASSETDISQKISFNESTSNVSLNESLREDGQKKRYSMEYLNKLRKSPLVSKTAPQHNERLISNKLDLFTWKFLFDKSFMNNCNDNIDSVIVPSFARDNLSRKNSNSNLNNSGKNCRRNKHQSSPPEKIKISLKKDVELNEAENAWKPSALKENAVEILSREERDKKDLEKKVRSLLNKLTAENFNILIPEIQRYKIDTSDKLDIVINILFEKSIAEPTYAPIYSKLCKEIAHSHNIPIDENNKSKSKNSLKVRLISRCQLEFERSKEDAKFFQEIEERKRNASPAEREELDDLHLSIRKRANGTVQFIGELYKNNLLTQRIMTSCIDVLLEPVVDEHIERVCKLLTTVGAKMESEGGKMCLNDCFEKLERLITGPKTLIETTRIKFDVMNVCELRKASWVPRAKAKSNEINVRPLAQVEKDTQHENQMREVKLQEYNEGSRSNKKNNMQNGHFNQNYNNHYNQKQQQQQQRNYYSNKDSRYPQKDPYNARVKIDFGKVPFLKSQSEVKLGPPDSSKFQNFGFKAQREYRSSNSYSSLEPERDNIQEPTGKYYTHGKNNCNYNESSNKNQQKELTRIEEKPVEKEAHEVELTQSEVDQAKDDFLANVKAYENSKLTLEQLKIKMKMLKINKTVLEELYSTFLDRTKDQREFFIEILTDLINANVVSKTKNLSALELVIELAEEFMLDIGPQVYKYIGEYCLKSIQCGILTCEELSDICKCEESQEKILPLIKVEKKGQDSSCNIPESANGEKESENMTEKQAIVAKKMPEDKLETIAEECDVAPIVKSPNEFKNISSKIEYLLQQKPKRINFGKVYDTIDNESCKEHPHFIRELTQTVLKACELKKGFRSTSALSKQLSDRLKVLVRYIDSDIAKQLECLESLEKRIKDYRNSDGTYLITLNSLFEVFYDNEVIAEEAFKLWRTERQNKRENDLLNMTRNFFKKLEE